MRVHDEVSREHLYARRIDQHPCRDGRHHALREYQVRYMHVCARQQAGSTYMRLEGIRTSAGVAVEGEET